MLSSPSAGRHPSARRPRVAPRASFIAGLVAGLAGLAACEPLPEDGRTTPTPAACEGMSCPADSTCTVVDGDPFCDCNDGFVGSPGFSASACYPASDATGTCRDTDQGIVCDCQPGYRHVPPDVGCTPSATRCEDLACADDAYCQVLAAGVVCACKPGFSGDGVTCTQNVNPNSCEGVVCHPDATCSGGQSAATCSCKPGFVGDGVTSCVPGAAVCSPPCAANASCTGTALAPLCACDAGYFGSGATACYPETTATGTCTANAQGVIQCSCAPGYAQASPTDVACSDIDECKLADQGGCTAWCTNTPGASTCTSTVADESSPYWSASCDPAFSTTSAQTNLMADCRCGKNKLVEGPLGLCQRPTGAYERGFSYGSGPRMADLYENLPRVPAGVFDPTARKIFLGIGYTMPTDSYVGAILEIDADTGDRRVVAGRWPDEFGGTVYGSGIAPYLPEVQNLALGPDGALYAWVRSVLNNAQIVRVDRATGTQTVLWREHLVLRPELNDAGHAQCPNGSLLPGSRTFVQVHERGFLVEASGDFLLTAMSNNTGNHATPIGIIRIAADGSQCSWVRRASAGSANAFAGADVGSGAAPQAGIPFRALYAHAGKVWAIDNFAEVYELDPANAWRTRNFASDLAEDWMAWDAGRNVMWMAGSGGGSNTIVAYSPNDTAALRWATPITCDNPTREGFGCADGPLETCCLNHNPMFFDAATGHVIVQHDIFGTVRIEVETGNAVTFSL